MMSQPRKFTQTFETSEEDFVGNYKFDIEDGLRKSVRLVRTGKIITVEILYVDGVVTDATTETFEADGPMKISVEECGVYLTGYRDLLAGRVRLRRTRFF